MTDRILVYIGTYTHGDSPGEGIYVYRFDPSTGGLWQIATEKGIENPSYLKISRDGKFLYVVSEVDESGGIPGGALMAYSIDQQSGALSQLNTQSTKGAYPCHVILDATGQYAIVSNYMGGNIAMLPVNRGGSLQPANDLVQYEGSSKVNAERQEGPHAHSVSLTPENKYAIAADLGNDVLHVHALDLEEGKFGSNPCISILTKPGAGPRHMDFHPNGHYLFLLNELDNTINSYGYNGDSLALTWLNTVSTLPEDFSGATIAADIHVHPGGKFLYASNRGHDSIAMYAIDESNGALALLGHQSSLGEHPRNFGIDPAGRFLLVANKDTNNVVTFKIDGTTGLLQPGNQVVNLPSPVCLAFVS